MGILNQGLYLFCDQTMPCVCFLRKRVSSSLGAQELHVWAAGLQQRKHTVLGDTQASCGVSGLVYAGHVKAMVTVSKRSPSLDTI